MIFITRVERKGKKIHLTFSDSTRLKISSDVFKKFNLTSGEQIDYDLLEKVKYENEYFEAKVTALRLLSIRNHSISELKVKLIKKNFSLQVIQKVLDELNDLNYLNDRKFAEQFYNELMNKFFGPLKIKNELVKKGIDKKIVDEILYDYFQDEEMQKNIILQYLQKNKFPKVVSSNKELQKIYNHLISRGFLDSSIRKSLKEKYINNFEDDVLY